MEERREAILQQVHQKGKVNVADLSKEFGCSLVTIRKDIQALHDAGLVKRIHGGAVRNHREDLVKYDSESIFRDVEKKEKIANLAYEYLEDEDIIIIDDASSSFYLALVILDHPEKRLTVITNSIPVANELTRADHVELFMIGGLVQKNKGTQISATMGETALNNISQFHVNKAFIGVHSINFKVGLISVGSPQMLVKKEIMKVSEKVFVLANSTKFGGSYLSVICPTQDVYKIITDDEISPENLALAKETNCPLVVAH
ncbi:MAG: DeoR/GlpR family DNA-binding transcription regulator [Eubacteriales bacterium]|nr:DeoR/GlpR family DNA-binding transcription regulator [Eubacteriales bacterium]